MPWKGEVVKWFFSSSEGTHRLDEDKLNSSIQGVIRDFDAAYIKIIDWEGNEYRYQPEED